MALSPCNTTTDIHQRELISHGTTEFPIAVYEDDLPNTSVPWHWHDELEFALVMEGNPVFLLENVSVPMHPGQGIFINGGALHAVEEKPGERVILHSAVFHQRLIGGSMESLFWRRYIQPLMDHAGFRYLLMEPQNDWQGEMLQCFHEAWKAEVHEDEDFENTVRYELTKALGILNRHVSTGDRPLSVQQTLEAERIRGMLAYMEEHFAEDITVQQIADSVSISAGSCLNCFNKILGTTPIQYLRSLRLDKAAELLRISHKTAKEAALECGFNDVSYFTKSFRTKMGVTPKEYQKQWHGRQ